MLRRGRDGRMTRWVLVIVAAVVVGVVVGVAVAVGLDAPEHLPPDH